MIFVINPVTAQKKGSFNETITFNSEQRTLSCWVPNDYDSTKDYQLMIGLHGLGDNSTNFRNALINNLNWKTHFSNTIFVFPDGRSDQFKDHYLPQGDEEIIAKAIEFAVNNYSIDTTRIILQGFSLGGRSALMYGLDHPGKFFGLLLNTPAIQGIADAQNIQPGGLVYDYQNATKVPIFIANGGADFLYISPIQFAFEAMVKNDGIVRKTTIPGLGHNIPSFNHLSGVIDFFENPHGTKPDADLVKIEIPQRTCQTSVDAKVLLRSTGNADITSLDLEYKVGATAKSISGPDFWNLTNIQ